MNTLLTKPAAPTLGSAEAFERTPYHLTDEQIQFFDDNGYLILKNWITGDLLRHLQAAGDAWIEAGLNAREGDPEASDYAFADRGDSRVFYRVDYLHHQGQPASLELLGCPQVLAVAESLCGPNFVPTYESMVFKMKGDGNVVEWHQDATHPRRTRIFNYDLYLDHSRAGAGALRVIPGTQNIRQDICKVAAEYEWNPPGVIEVEMEPGDVLLHDVMVVHGSPRTIGQALRRTIYYEFRAAEQIMEEGPWDREWVDRRMRMLPVGLKSYQEAFPNEDQFTWNVDDEFRPEPVEAAELRIPHIVGTPGSYCSAGSVA